MLRWCWMKRIRLSVERNCLSFAWIFHRVETEPLSRLTNWLFAEVIRRSVAHWFGAHLHDRRYNKNEWSILNVLCTRRNVVNTGHIVVFLSKMQKRRVGSITMNYLDVRRKEQLQDRYNAFCHRKVHHNDGYCTMARTFWKLRALLKVVVIF